MTIEEAIKHCEEVAEELEEEAVKGCCDDTEIMDNCLECAKEHRQLAEWLRELKIHREIHDVLLQFMVDSDLDICCDELMNDEKEKLICEENCENKTKNCWVRWAKLKARELNELRDFANFVAESVMEEDFEENSNFYAEVLCRKLTKLGKLKVVDNKYMEVNADEKDSD